MEFQMGLFDSNYESSKEDSSYSVETKANNYISSTLVEEYSYSFMGQNVRVLDTPGGVLFVARDVCLALGYANPSKAVSDHCKGVPISYTLDTPGGRQGYRVINEGDVYRLIFGSRLPAADRFERWVCDEVLPTIRRQGSYVTTESVKDLISNKIDFVIQLALQVKEEQDKSAALERKLEHSVKQIGIMEPKAALADAFLSSNGNILVRNFAKHVKQALGLKSFGERAMFKWLRDNKYLNADKYPSQRAVDLGLLFVYEGTHYNPVTGQQDRHHTTRITTKGQEYFYSKLKEEFNSGNIMH